MSATSLTPWSARLLHRATGADLLHAACIVAFAVLAVWSGRVAARHLSPDGAASASLMLDELELPGTLPNAILTRDDGVQARLYDLTLEPRTLVSFYAPWCAPCQQELPTLVRGTTQNPARFLVVVGADEDQRDVRRKLDDLGLEQLRYYVDTDGQLQRGGRVTALPATFLLGRSGRVVDRVVGYSEMRVNMLVFKAIGGQAGPFVHED